MKAWLSEHGIEYTIRDLRTDAEARREFVAAGFRLPPVVVVVGGPAIEGYRPGELERALGADVWPGRATEWSEADD